MKVLVALETCDEPKYAPRRKLIESTWAKRLPVGYEFISFTGKMLDVPDDYYHLSEKTKAICQFAKFYTFDWLLIVDDDVFIRTDKLRIPIADYAGHILEDREDRFCSGGCYWLSRRAFSVVADAPFNPLIAPSADDRWVGWVMRQNGFEPAGATVALRPCYCGHCVPKPEPAYWSCYIIDPLYSEALFLEFEERFGRIQTR